MGVVIKAEKDRHGVGWPKVQMHSQLPRFIVFFLFLFTIFGCLGLLHNQSPNLARKLGDNRSTFVSEFRYLAAFSNAGGSKLCDSPVMLKMMPNLAHFLPP